MDTTAERVVCERCKGFGRQRRFDGHDAGLCPNCHGRGWHLSDAVLRATTLRALEARRGWAPRGVARALR
jgi:DnaJ-class molecular chaperone